MFKMIYKFFLKRKLLKQYYAEQAEKMMEENKTKPISVPIQIDEESIQKLEKIKKLLDDIKISYQEVKDLFK